MYCSYPPQSRVSIHQLEKRNIELVDNTGLSMEHNLSVIDNILLQNIAYRHVILKALQAILKA